MIIAHEVDWDALREQRNEEEAKEEIERLAKLIEIAENEGNYELAEKRTRRLMDLQNGEH
jgi:ArsR family metal-binding transcriptional regulator